MAFSPSSCADCTYFALQEASSTYCSMSFLRRDFYHFLAISNSEFGNDSSTPQRQEACRI